MELDPELSVQNEPSWVGRWSWAKSIVLDVFCFELSNLFVNSGATDIVLVTLSSTAVERAIAQCTSRWAMARGHRLNTSIVLAAVHGLSGLFRAVSAVKLFTLSPPSHSVPVPDRPTRLCGRKATLNQTAESLSPQCPCRGRLFVYCCGRCSCVHLRGEPVNNYFSMACSAVSYWCK